MDNARSTWGQDFVSKVAGAVVVTAVLGSVGVGFGSWVALHDLGDDFVQLDKRHTKTERNFEEFMVGKSRFSAEGSRISRDIAELKSEYKTVAARLRALELKARALEIMQSMQGNNRMP